MLFWALSDFDLCLQILRPRIVSQAQSQTNTVQPARPGKVATDIAHLVNLRRQKRKQQSMKKGTTQEVGVVDGAEVGDVVQATADHEGKTSVNAQAEFDADAGVGAASTDDAAAADDDDAADDVGANAAAAADDAPDGSSASEAAVLQKQDAASVAGCAIGSHIEVEWQKGTWYPGVVTDFDLDVGEHFAVYDDGEDEQFEDLQTMPFRFLEGAVEGGAVVDEGGAVDAGEVVAGSRVEHPSATVTTAVADSIKVVSNKC